MIACDGATDQNNLSSTANGVTLNIATGAVLSVPPVLGGTAVTLSGNGITVNNQGTIDPTINGGLSLAAAGMVLGNNTAGGNTINVNNQNLGGAVRGDWVRNPNLPSGERTIDRWFDPTFAVASAPGVVSNVGRNVIIGPGRQNVDFMVSRLFRLPWEGHALQVRFEAFNGLNHANFGNPNAGVGTPTVGRITTAEDPRRIQFGLKYNF